LRFAFVCSLPNVKRKQLVEEANPLIDIGIDGVIRLGKVARVKQSLANCLQVVLADCVGEDRQQIVDAGLRQAQALRVVE
jgi:hypothetical protein